MKKTFYLAACTLAGFLSILSCDGMEELLGDDSKKNDPEKYTIKVESDNNDRGTTSGGGTYTEGDSVTLTAIAKPGYYFEKWSDGRTENPRKFAVSDGVSLRAIFRDYSGTISQNTTWKDLNDGVDYILDGNLYIEGNTLLTVEPGVTIMLIGKDYRIITDENAGLKMVGTEEKPIIVKGSDDNRNNGSWKDITINSIRNDNRMEYVQLLRGGNVYDNEGVVNNRGRLSMKNCIIDGSLKNGVSYHGDDNGKFADFENNTIKNAVLSPLFLNQPFLAECIGHGNVYENCGAMYIVIDNHWEEANLHPVFTFPNPGIPYRMTCGLDVEDNQTLVIDAGVVMQFAANDDFWASSGSHLNINGTREAPVILSGYNDEAGSWKGMFFHSEHNNNNISWTTITGCKEQCLYLYENAILTLDNVTLSKSNYYGASIYTKEETGRVAGLTYSDITFEECGLGNVYDRRTDVSLSELP
ncbi:MAG: hypothetical protein IKS24_05510 [Bacteroidaceae bacterium]|nr:hypothetical protein [Bacteroidaceae bacterium]